MIDCLNGFGNRALDLTVRPCAKQSIYDQIKRSNAFESSAPARIVIESGLYALGPAYRELGTRIVSELAFTCGDQYFDVVPSFVG